MAVKLTIPDLGDFQEVEVIEVLAAPGDVVAVEDPLITLETDKATMDVPAEQAGKIVSVDVSVGDRVSKGDPLVTIEAPDAGATADDAAADEMPGDEEPRDEKAAADTAAESADETRRQPRVGAAAAKPAGDATHSAQLVVIGAGPAGLMAAMTVSAICLVRFSWICSRRANMSTMRAILDSPITLPRGR